MNNLIKYLEEKINETNEIIEKYNIYIKNDLYKYNKIKDKLLDNIENIKNIPLKTIYKIIDIYTLSNKEKSALKNDIKIIIDKIKKSEKLRNKDNMNLLLFLKELNNYLNNNKDNFIDNYNEIKNIKKLNKKYISMLNGINNKEHNYIKDSEILEGIIKDKDKSCKELNDLLTEIFEYNKNINTIKNDIKFLNNTKDKLVKITEIFKDYNLDINMFSETFTNNILNNSTIKNINTILKCLNDNQYTFTKDNEYILMSLLIKGKEKTINEITKLALENGLTRENILSIGSILINQELDLFNNKKINRFDITSNNNQLLIVGSNLDFINNIEELNKWDLSVKEVFNINKFVLVVPKEILEHNLVLFQEYGFSLRNRERNLLSSTIEALTKYNNKEIIDRFIESHPLAIKYLRNNLSILKQITNIDDLLFYKLYYSYKYLKEDKVFIKSVDNNNINLFLKKNITKESIFMNRENKNYLANIYKPEFSKKYKLLDITNDLLTDEIFTNKYIIEFNKYTSKTEPLLYDFNGVIISKLKVLRTLDNIIKQNKSYDKEDILYSLLNNTLISKEDYINIKNIIDNIK